MAPNSASSTARRGLITMSHPPANSASSGRNASRTLRRIRFRTTALPTARGIVSPSRAWLLSSHRKQNAVKSGPGSRTPSSYTRRNSGGRNSLELLGKLPRGEGEGRLLGVANGSFVTHGQLVAAFRAAAREHLLAVLALHARPEAVRLCTLAIVRLKSTLRHCFRSLPRLRALSRSASGHTFPLVFCPFSIHGRTWGCHPGRQHAAQR